MHTKSGFTLIELLVVIAIISLLSSIIYTSVGSAKIKATNVANAQKARELGKAIAQYSLASLTEPIPTAGADTLVCASKTCTISGVPGVVDPNLESSLSEYFPEMPDDTSSVSINGSDYSGILYRYDSSSEQGSIYYPQQDSSSCPIGYSSLADSAGMVCGFIPEDMGSIPLGLYENEPGYDNTAYYSFTGPTEGGPNGNMRIDLALTNTLGANIVCRAYWYSGGGTASDDEVLVNGSLVPSQTEELVWVIPDGSYSSTISLETVDDLDVEGTENIVFSSFDCIAEDYISLIYSEILYTDITAVIYDND